MEQQDQRPVKPIVFFDIESTGPDPVRDRIVQIAALRWPNIPRTQIDLDSGYDTFAALCNPGVIMSEEVMAIHRITNSMVATRPVFRTFCPQLLSFIEGCDLAGFNIINFDLILLWEELNRSGFTLDLEGVRVIDASEIFRRKERRTLGAAVEKYCGHEHVGAHDALFDTMATAEVLAGQLRNYADLGSMDRGDLAAFTGDQRVDLAGKIVRNAAGVPVYSLGAAKGVPVVADPGFGRWMQRQLWVGEQTKRVIDRLLRDAQHVGSQA